jgi:hypothetical protein
MSDFEKSLNAWLEPLAKKQEPEHFRLVRQATDAKGPEYVDHQSQKAHPPPHLDHHIRRYHESVVNSHATVPPEKKTSLRGVTRKLVFKGSDGERYMVKPYHERVVSRMRPWMAHPIQGWAEMANQGLYHAAGIGDLHQNVHIEEQNMGAGAEREPALVVHLAHGFNTFYYGHHDPQERDKLKSILHQHKGMIGAARQVAVMDFLTNNLDRHAGNLLWHPDGRLLAIDHSRSFQYKADKKWGFSPQERRGHRYDSLQNYVSSDPLEIIKMHGPFVRERDHLYGRRDLPRWTNSELWEPTFEWWGKAGPAVRARMKLELQHIRSPLVRAHIERNFNARAALLDDMAKWGVGNYGQHTWHKHQVPIYRLNEKAEDE